MRCPVTVEKKENAFWADDAIRRTSYTKRAFLPWEYNNDREKVYIGMFAENWKQGLYNHRHSFSTPQLRNQTALSKYFGTLRIRG